MKEKKEKYITEDNLIEDQTYLGIKNLIRCPKCNNIYKNPMQCNKCQKIFCKKCINDSLENKNICPNNCTDPNFQESEDKNCLLSLLKFLCKNCQHEINYNDVESHLNNGCATNAVETKLFYEIFAKKKLKKIKEDEINKLKGKEVNHLSSKL